MMSSKCRLCAKSKTLQESHIWPRFAYKRYASDLARGGQFYDLGKMRVTNQQYKEYWFCSDCEQALGRDENNVRSLCERIESGKPSPFDYNASLLRFLASVSWRVAMFDLTGGEAGKPRACGDALKKWRRFLLGRCRDVGMYTQHLFVAVDPKGVMHRRLGGQILAEQHVVVSQVGPLTIAGLLGRAHLAFSARERAIWEQSKVSRDGGTIQPLDYWRVGSKITWSLIKVLTSTEAILTGKAREMVSARR
jgi:hypothetical protein